MEFDSIIPEEWITVFQNAITDYVQKYKDNMVARNILSRRQIGETVITDVTLHYDETGPDAGIVAKGSVPYTFSHAMRTERHAVWKLATAFMIDERDLKADPQMQTRDVDIGMRKLHRLEDNLAINGSTTHNILGLVSAARSGDYGKVVASGATGKDENNVGAWTGDDSSGKIDIFDDVLTAYGMMDPQFEPAYLLGRRSDLLNMWKLDSERRPYVDTIAGLLTGNEKNRDWIVYSDFVPAGYVYLVAKDPMFAEMVHAIDIMVEPYPKQPGGMFMVEMKEWLSPIQVHNNGGVIEIQIT